MKIFLSVILITFTSITAQTWQLVWSDEFDGSQINFNNWTRETGGNGWGNNELQYYTSRDDNSYIENGHLIIKAMKENYGGKQYTSARLKTQGKKFFQYGKIEARIKLPYGKGIWPAFWLLGENISSVGWPACGEIDVMEMVGGDNGDNTVHGTVHWDENGHAQYGGSYTLSNGIFADDYHTFAIVWTPKKILWYVDNIQYHSIDLTSPGLSEFQNEFFIILNLAVGGNWPGYPDASTVFPQTMEVDYVRVYEDTSAVPKVSVANPANNANLDEGSNSKITAEASVQSGTINRVDFYQEAVKIGSTSIFPYEMTWRNLSAGCYNIYAIATSSEGYKGSSDTVSVTVGSGCPQSSFLGYNHFIPGIIEAENFDTGGNGEAYNDTDAGNSGSTYRNEDVDIEECSDEYGGYNIGWINPSEWLEYSVIVSKTGNYDFRFRVASVLNGGKIDVLIDGNVVAQNISISSTGGWQSWSDVFATNIPLNEGEHIIKLSFAAGQFNLNYFEVYESGTAPSITLLSPAGGEIYGVGTVQEILWRADRVYNVKIGLSTDGGSDWSFVSFGTEAKFGEHRWIVPDQVSDNCLIMVLDAANFSVKDVNATPFSITSTVDVKHEGNTPLIFNLFQNYPNPFNPTTQITYQIPKSSFVTLKVYDTLGKEVTTLVNERKEQGRYTVEFNTESALGGLPSGMYIYQITAGKFRASGKMLLMK